MSFSITSNGITVTGDLMTEVFSQLAELEEVFGVTECGKCKGTKLSRVVRTVDGNDYHELRCLNPNCKAKLWFHVNKNQTKKGGLYIERKNKDGTWKPYGGWE